MLLPPQPLQECLRADPEYHPGAVVRRADLAAPVGHRDLPDLALGQAELLVLLGVLLAQLLAVPQVVQDGRRGVSPLVHPLRAARAERRCLPVRLVVVTRIECS
jgi:hypothetical protein